MAHAHAEQGAPAAEEDAAALELGEFKDKYCLWNAEVDLILTHYLDTVKDKSGGDGFEASPMLEDTLKYVRQFNNYSQKQALESAREAIQREEFAGIDQFEVACICNLDINDVDEALSLIPSLRRVDEEVLSRLLEELKMYRTT